jgi:hypothetical protein
MAQVHWRKFALQTTVWLVAEVLLTCLGTDDLADYSEFHFIYRDDTIARLDQSVGMNGWLGPAG